VQPDGMEELKAAIECVLLDHADQLSGENVDANLSELAYVYEQLTGWTVERELGADWMSTVNCGKR
jgi:hypothetical protein